ncbi:hypothetical protein [Roseateles sp.]|uniref:hypothetical protein n=1 Tax=Roseateles sp. TaxID=1971397 RepID=UPI00394E5740
MTSRKIGNPPPLTRADEIDRLPSDRYSRGEKRRLKQLLHGEPAVETWQDQLGRDWGANQASRAVVVDPADAARWRYILGTGFSSGSAFEIDLAELLRRGLDKPFKAKVGTVSDFADWVYRLYVPQKSIAGLRAGSSAELEIETARQSIRPPAREAWELVYRGLWDSEAPSFEIPELNVKGVPLRGKPDLVFREKKTGRILILDIKLTEHRVPRDGWPNVWAQLWAYSKVPMWRDAPEVILAAEFWSYRSLNIDITATLNWKSSDPLLNHRARLLFDCYKRRAEKSSVTNGRGTVDEEAG